MRRNKRLLLLLVAMGVIAGGVMLSKASAQGISLNELLFPPSPNDLPKTSIQLTNPLMEQKEIQDEKDLSDLSAAANNFTNDQTTFQTVSDLITKADKEFIKPGWLHIISVKERFPSVPKLLPNGDPIPTRSENDAWYLLGENGYVIKAVIVDNTGEVLTSQVVVFEDGLWKNLTIPETNPTEKEIYQIETLDQGLMESSSQNQIGNVEEVEDSEGSGTLIVVTKTERFDAPVLVDQTTQVYGMISKYTLSKNSGRILILESYQIFPDDSIVLWDRITTTTVENLNIAPDNILDYFKE